MHVAIDICFLAEIAIKHVTLRNDAAVRFRLSFVFSLSSSYQRQKTRLSAPCPHPIVTTLATSYILARERCGPLRPI